MLSDEVIEKVVERLVNRIEEANTYTLKKIGGTIKKIGTINPSDVQQLIEAIQYGADYDKIVKKLAEVSELNEKDIYKIFEEVAKTDSRFAKQFYEYRNKKYIPYEENINLQRQIKEIADITAETYRNITRNNVIGFKTTDENGKVIHRGIEETYQDVVDRAVMAISQGKDTYQGQVYSIMKELGTSGLTTVEYASGRSVRLDSAVRMQLRSAVRDLHNSTQEELGKEFNADGVEISVHGHPAPDHEDVQGRQFSNDEFRNFQNDKLAVSYDGIEFSPDYNNRDRRAISQYNCYHYTFSIILGVNLPQYTDEQLKKIKEDNEAGFEFEGKHYTLYEGTQLQRQIETEIRKQKDLQILGKAGGNEKLANESQLKINQLTQKYYELHQASGLPTKLDRLRVEGYTEIELDKEVVEPEKKNGSKLTLRKEKEVKETPKELSKEEREEYYHVLVSDLNDKKVEVNGTFMLVDEEIRNEELEQLNSLLDKYPLDRYNSSYTQLSIRTRLKNKNNMGTSYYQDRIIELNSNHFDSKDDVIETQGKWCKSGWNYDVPEDKIILYTLTHEYGHQVEYEYFRKTREEARRAGRRFSFTEADKNLRDTIMSMTLSKTGENLGVTEFKDKYFSRYGKSKRNYEWFAEVFAKSQLGEQTPFTEAFQEWLEGFYK